MYACVYVWENIKYVYIYRVGGIPGTDHQDPCIACTVLQHLMQEDWEVEGQTQSHLGLHQGFGLITNFNEHHLMFSQASGLIYI